jgi:Ca2+-binding RTX toxin-like protein
LSGGNAVDKINGGAGDDRITGGASSDALTGGSDHDTFVFDTPLADAGVDTISDFDATNASAGHDFIELSSSVFGVTASGGLLSSSQFVALATASSSYTSTTAKVVYDQATGNLYYDANGSVGGLTDAVVFATLTNKPTAMDATDIKVV